MAWRLLREDRETTSGTRGSGLSVRPLPSAPHSNPPHPQYLGLGARGCGSSAAVPVRAPVCAVRWPWATGSARRRERERACASSTFSEPLMMKYPPWHTDRMLYTPGSAATSRRGHAGRFVPHESPATPVSHTTKQPHCQAEVCRREVRLQYSRSARMRRRAATGGSLCSG